MSTAPEVAHLTATARVDERSLLKTMHWYDGFVMALSNPGFIIANIGYTTGSLGALGALAVWVGSMLIAIVQNKVYTEPATMFPEHSGGIAMYAFEGWRSRFSLAGPMSAIGYWAGWSSVLAIFGLTIGNLVQAQWIPKATWGVHTFIHLDTGRLIAIGLILGIWGINVLGIKPVKILGYLTGGLLIVPVVLFSLVPFFLTDFHAGNLTWGLSGPGMSFGTGVQLALVWLYLNAWSAYGIEVCATFAPEYHDTKTDTNKAMARSGMFALAVYALLPLATGGSFSQSEIGANPLGFYVTLLDREVGSFLGNVVIVLMIGSFILGMNAASAGGARTLYGMSQKGMTIKWLGHINRNHVPSRGMYVDVALNVLAVLFLPTTVAVLAASNLGYVICHVFALSGVLLLRRDRPNWPRPLRLSTPWLYVAGVLAAFNLLLVVVGATSFDITGYGGLPELWMGIGLLLIGCALYVYRRVVQDRLPFQLRDRAPIDEPAAELLVEPALVSAGERR